MAYDIKTAPGYQISPMEKWAAANPSSEDSYMGNPWSQSSSVADAILAYYKANPVPGTPANPFQDVPEVSSAEATQQAIQQAMSQAGYKSVNTSRAERPDLGTTGQYILDSTAAQYPLNMSGDKQWYGYAGAAKNPTGVQNTAGAGGTEWIGQYMPMLMAALGGAAAGGFLPGTESAFGGTTLGGAVAADTVGAGALPTWAGGAAETLGGGVAGTELGGASLASQGLTTGAGVGSGFAGGTAGTLGAAGIDAASTALPAWAGGASGTSLGGTTTLADLVSKLQTMPPGSGSALSKLLSGQDLTAQDIASLTTAGLGALTGIAGADASRSANNAAADKMLALGAPARAEYNRTIAPGFDPSSMPGYTSAIDSVMNSYLRKASTGGNPFSNPGVSMEANKYVTDTTALPAINNYRNSLVGAGNIGVGNANQPNVNAAGAVGGATNAVAGGLGALSAPNNGIDFSKLSDQLSNFFRWNAGTSAA